MSVQTLIQVRRGTTSEWLSANPTLSAGEWGLDTTTGRYKIGDGLTAWNSLSYAAIRPSSNDLTATSGIGIDFASTTGIPVTISVTGIYSSQMVDFNSAVDARISVATVSAEDVQDIVASGDHVTTGFLRNGTGISLDYNDGNNTLTVNVSGYSLLGHNHDDRYYTETELNTSGLGAQVHYGNLTNLPTGFVPVSHTHTLANGATDVTATAAEVNYLDLTTGPGTAEASKALVLDSNKDISGIGSITTTGNISIGGNLTVQGTTTTVNSTTVDIGDNIIRVNTSGLSTGGLEVYTGSVYNSLIWDNGDNRWEFTGGNVYTSGYFVGNLSGNASTVTNGVYTTDTGTVTSTMIANNTIVDADINNTAAIAVTKLASSGITLGSTTIVLGQTSSSIVGLTALSGTSTMSPTYLYNCVIDGGTP